MTSIARERELYEQVGFTHRLRSQWGAKFDYSTARDVDEPATRLFLHISVTDPDQYSSNDAHARAIEAIGISRFPNTGISYNELILPGGHPYEAQPMGRRGAHTVNDKQLSFCTLADCPSKGSPLSAPSWNLNINSRACCLARNVDDPVTDADVNAAARWAAAGKLAGMVSFNARWHGHRCVSTKNCPGDKGWARLDDIADLTADYVRQGDVSDMDQATFTKYLTAALADADVRKAMVKAVLGTDGVIPAPSTAPDKAGNPYWVGWSFLRETIDDLAGLKQQP